MGEDLEVVRAAARAAVIQSWATAPGLARLPIFEDDEERVRIQQAMRQEAAKQRRLREEVAERRRLKATKKEAETQTKQEDGATEDAGETAITTATKQEDGAD